MNDNSTPTEMLIQYLDKDLSPEQAIEIEQLRKQDPAVELELSQLSVAQESVRQFGLKQMIGDVHKEMMMESTMPASRGIVRNLFRNAARIAAVLLIVIGAVASYQYISVTPQKLFEDTYQGYNLHSQRGTAASELKQAYQQSDFQHVTTLYSKMAIATEEDIFLAGNAYLQLHEGAQAVVTFEKLKSKNLIDGTHLYEDDCDYFLAMSYLISATPAAAIPLLKKINADGNHPYHNKVNDWTLRKATRLHD